MMPDYRPKALLWKEIGGNLSAIKVRGRWYFLGTTDRELRCAAKEFRFERVQGVPPAIKELFKKYGQTTATLKRLPNFFEDLPVLGSNNNQGLEKGRVANMSQKGRHT